MQGSSETGVRGEGEVRRRNGGAAAGASGAQSLSSGPGGRQDPS